MNDLTLLTTLVTSPASAINSIRERPRYLFPLLVAMVISAAMIYWFYSVVDFEWLKHQLFDNAPQFQKLPEAQRAQAMNFMSRNTLMWGGMIGVIVGIGVGFVLWATCLLVAGKITGVRYRFEQWFALACWTAFPAILLNTIIAALMILTSSDTSQLMPDSLRPLSLNELFFHRAMGQPGQSFLSGVDLLNLWSLGLIVLGIRIWSERSWLFSFLFGLSPYVVVYGTWAVFAFR
jgi:hypothetical protein